MALAPIKIVIAGVDRFSNKMAKIHKSVKKMSAGMTRAGTKMSAGFTAPALAAGGAIFKAGYQFDKFMNMVEAKSTVSGKSIDDLRKKALELGSTTSFSHIQAAEGMNFLAQAGFNTNETFKAILPTLNLATATTSELGASADYLSNVMGGMDWGAERSQEAATILALTTAKSNVNLQQLAGTFAKVGPIAKNYGATMSDVAAAAGLLGNIGIQDEGGTVLKNMFLNISSGAPKVAKAFKALNVSVDDGKGKMRDFKDILLDMSKGLQKVTQREGLQIMEAIMGKRAIAGVTGLTTSLAKADSKFTDLVGTLGNLKDTDLQTMVDIMRKGSVGAWDDTISALQGMGQAIADSGLTEFIIKGLKAFTRFFRHISAKSPAMLKLGLIITGVVAAVGPLLLILGQIMPVITGLGSAIASAGGAAALLTNPIGWIVLAVAGLAATLALLWDELKPMRKVVAETFVKAIESMKPVAESLKPLFKSLVKLVRQLAVVFEPLATAILKSFGGGSLTAIRLFSAVLVTMVEMTTTLVDNMSDLTWILSKAAKDIKPLVGGSEGDYRDHPLFAGTPRTQGPWWTKLGLGLGGSAGIAATVDGIETDRSKKTKSDSRVTIDFTNMPKGVTAEQDGVPVQSNNMGSILFPGSF